MSEPTWVPVPQSLEYDLITHAIQHGEIPQEYRICRLVDAPDAPQVEGVAEPDWSQAPEWAMWWAVDADEGPHWYENEPFILAWGWANSKGLARGSETAKIPIGIDWRTTLRKRSAPAERSD